MQIELELVKIGFQLEGKIYVRTIREKTQYVELDLPLIKTYCYSGNELEYHYTINITDKDQIKVFINQYFYLQ